MMLQASYRCLPSKNKQKEATLGSDHSYLLHTGQLAPMRSWHLRRGLIGLGREAYLDSATSHTFHTKNKKGAAHQLADSTPWPQQYLGDGWRRLPPTLKFRGTVQLNCRRPRSAFRKAAKAAPVVFSPPLPLPLAATIT